VKGTTVSQIFFSGLLAGGWRFRLVLDGFAFPPTFAGVVMFWYLRRSPPSAGATSGEIMATRRGDDSPSHLSMGDLFSLLWRWLILPPKRGDGFSLVETMSGSSPFS